MKYMTICLFLAVSAFGLNACGTMHGAGQDMENAGEAVQDAAY
jgi:predicted small secreted protein